MRSNNYLLILLCLCFTAVSCKKENNSEVTISGTISDSAGAIAGANVDLSVKEISSGTFSSSFNELYSGTTGSDGKYSHTFTPGNPIEYKIEVLADNRFDEELIINADDVQRGTNNVYNFNLRPQAWYRVNIKNTIPFDSTDLLQYQISSSQESCPGCCNNLVRLFEGDVVDTTLKCMTTGNQMLKVNWVVTKNSIIQSYSDSVFCATGDTGIINLNY